MNKVDKKYLKDYEYFVKNRLLPLIGIDYNIVDVDTEHDVNRSS